jgi:hypothetical protein
MHRDAFGGRCESACEEAGQSGDDAVKVAWR